MGNINSVRLQWLCLNVWCSSASQTSHSTWARHSCCLYMLKIQFSWCTRILSKIFICRLGATSTSSKHAHRSPPGGINIQRQDIRSGSEERSLWPKRAGHKKYKIHIFMRTFPLFSINSYFCSCHSYCPTFFSKFLLDSLVISRNWNSIQFGYGNNLASFNPTIFWSFDLFQFNKRSHSNYGRLWV